jgi:hypothetical protein
MTSRTVSTRPLVLGIAILALGLLLSLAGCGSETTTTTTAFIITTTSSTTTTTTSTTTTTEPTTTTTEAPTTTEALSSAETRLADGTIKGMGFIDKVWEKNGKRYLSIDYAEFLTGDAATQAAIEAGDLQPGEQLDNDYYIRNVSAQKREFTVSASAVITTATRPGGMDEPASWKEFVSFWSTNPPEGTEHLHMVPWWIIRNGTEVISIAEQYLP